jgi:hypothetical protein
MSIATVDGVSPPATVASIILCRSGIERLAMGDFRTHAADELAARLGFVYIRGLRSIEIVGTIFSRRIFLSSR